MEYTEYTEYTEGDLRCSGNANRGAGRCDATGIERSNSRALLRTAHLQLVAEGTESNRALREPVGRHGASGQLDGPNRTLPELHRAHGTNAKLRSHNCRLSEGRGRH